MAKHNLIGSISPHQLRGLLKRTTIVGSIRKRALVGVFVNEEPKRVVNVLAPLPVTEKRFIGKLAEGR